MRRILRLGAAFLLTTVLVLSFVSHVRADTFNQNRIIDDGVFDNANSMSAAQINNWLNANFPSSCISTNNGFSSPDPVGYNPSQGYLYGGNVSGGQAIYDAAQAYGLNPQVLIATLQKESSVVSGTASYHCQYINTAMGYGCPDSGSCPTNPATMSGFSKQVIHAAWLLKFGEQRSEGNIGFNVQKPGWDNSDDPQTCYGGPMTQGTYQRCPSGASAFYDGYTTIDGTAVHMDDGATAALYWYTPHFSGNQHFFSLFTSWFGSTHYAQPLGSSLYQNSSNGVIYLIDNSNSTRYQVPDWDMMINYGLNYYPVQVVPPSTISSLTDGGLLTNLVYDNNGVYLVNNRTRYPVPSNMCTAWGFNCFDGNYVKPLGSVIQTQYLNQGSALNNLMVYGGVEYEMSSGHHQPIANPQTLSDLGLSHTAPLIASASNARQPLGALLITTPGVIQLSPDPHIYYFDGTNWWTVSDMNTYYDWRLNQAPHLSVPVSSYNQTPPSSTLFNSWVLSSSKDYIVDQGRKLLVPGGLTSLWAPSQFASSYPTGLFNSLPQDGLSSLILASPNVYLLNSSGKHYVQTIYEYSTLQASIGKVTNIRSDKVASVTQGNDALVDGDVIIVNDGSGIIYAVNNGGLTHISSPNVFEAYGYSWGAVRSYPSGITSDYPIDGTILNNGISSDGIHYIVSGSSLYQLSSTQATDFGAIDADFTPITKQAVRRTPGTMSHFLLNADDGRVYYGSGGALHYVSSYDSYVAHGGLNSPRISVNSATIASFNAGSSI
jgi:hypothetical protein